MTISVTITNTGEMDGDEVTQVYLRWTNTTIPAPTKQLVGVNRSMIMKGKTLKLTFLITAAQMKIWTSKWIIPLGKIIVYVGGQQPGQHDTVPSNILEGNFVIMK